MTLEHWSLIISLTACGLALLIAGYSWQRLRPLSIGVLGWFGLAWMFSQRGFFQSAAGWQDGDITGFIIFGTLMSLPLAVFFATWWRIPSFQAFLARIPLPALIGIEVYRVAGAIFWWMYAQDMMPTEMGLFTGFADVFIGATALPLAWAVARGMPGSRRLAVAWNIFGISDFLIAISLVSLSIFGLVNLQPAPVMIGLHPLALIALFQLPLSIGIHVIALNRIIKQEGRSAWQQSSSLAHPKASA